ncbi:hypothetical protein AB7M59_006286 [Bradyrhizobium elkanii]|jgi:hypothetical protein
MRCGAALRSGLRRRGKRGTLRRRPCESRDPYAAACVVVGTRRSSAVQQLRFGVMGPGLRQDDDEDGSRAMRCTADAQLISLSSPGSTGRSSIPETLVLEPRSRGVLDHPHARAMTPKRMRARCSFHTSSLRKQGPITTGLRVETGRGSSAASQLTAAAMGPCFRRDDTACIALPVSHTFAFARHESPVPCSSTRIRGQNDGHRFAPPILPVSHHFPWRRRRRITRVRRPGRFDQQQMHLLPCDRTMLDAFRHDVHLPGS